MWWLGMIYTNIIFCLGIYGSMPTHAETAGHLVPPGISGMALNMLHATHIEQQSGPNSIQVQ